ncbi:MAG: hypothetical protein DRH26_18300, partial [Deltaproteobacteria bacterium]
IRKEELMSVRQEDFTVGLCVNGRCYEISQLDKTLTESAATAKKEGRSERSSVNLRMIVIREINKKTGEEKDGQLFFKIKGKTYPVQ